MIKKLLPYKSRYILFFTLLAFFILLLASYIYFRIEKNNLLSIYGKDLSSISSLREEQISSWYNERLAEAKYLNENEAFNKIISNFYLNRNIEDSLSIYHSIYPIFKNHGYRSIFILDKDRKYLSNLNPSYIPDSAELSIIDSCLYDNRIEVSDIRRNSKSHLLFYDIIVPVIFNNVTIAAIVFNIDPGYAIFNFVKKYYVISKSIESLIFLVEGDSLIFISPLRFNDSEPLTIKRSIHEKKLPAAMVADGYDGIVTGTDYRGVEVLAYGHEINTTPWYMVTKQDISEILKPLIYRMIMIGIIIYLIVGLWAALILYHNNKQNLIHLKKINESELKFSELVEQASDGILITDKNLNILEANSAACNDLGYELTELLKLKFTDIVEPKDLENQPLKLKEIMEGKTIRIVRKLLRKDGSIFPADISGKQLSSGNFLALIRDITERKKFETELIEAKEKAEEMNRLKSSFLANMSHELRTPMVGILGYSEILSEEITQPDLLKMAKDISRSGKRLLETLNSILDMSRIESNKYVIEPSRFSLTKLLLDEINLYKSVAQLKNISLSITLPEQELIIVSDKKMLQSIISNLINNALKFTPVGGVTLRASLEKKSAGFVIIKVIDTGIGISKESQEIIFDEFRQASEGVDRKYEGTGLGLTITKNFVELLNGTICLKSEHGKGSEFSVEIPLIYTLKS
jgi:PAS domain S-box-containing protein